MKYTKIYCCDCEGVGYHYWPVYGKCESCNGTGTLDLDPPWSPFDPATKAALCFAAATVGAFLLIWAMGWGG